VAPDAEGDVVVAIGLDATTGAPRFQVRGAGGGRPVRSGPVGVLADGTFAVGMAVEEGPVSFHRFDATGRPRGRAVVAPDCPVLGTPHWAPGELARAALGRPLGVPGGGALVSWVVDGVGCLERWDAFGARPLWAAAEAPLLATASLALTAAARGDDLLLVARDLASGAVAWELEGADWTPLAAAGDLVYALDGGPRADEVEARLADDPEMADGHPQIAAPVRLAGLDAATGAERWAIEVEGDVGSVVLDGRDLLLAAAREDGSGTLRRVDPSGRETSRLAIDAPPAEAFADPPPWLGVPRLVGVRGGAALWHGPDGIGALRLEGATPSEAWRLDEPSLRAPPLVARTDAPLLAGPPDAAADGGVLVLRLGERLVAYALP
jgi:hypothetical protein